LVSASEDETIKIWNLNTGRLIRTLQSGQVCSLIGLKYKIIVAGSFEIIQIWDSNKLYLRNELYGHTSWINCLLDLDNGDFASGSSDYLIKIWNINIKWTFWKQNDNSIRTLKGHTDEVMTLAFLSVDILASGSLDKTIKIWNFREGNLIKTLTKNSDPIMSLALLNGNRLASGNSAGIINIWNLNNYKKIKIFNGHKSWVWCLVNDFKSDTLISGSYDSNILLWNTKNGKLKQILTSYTMLTNIAVFNKPTSYFLINFISMSFILYCIIY